jgi:hypothetical protein
MPYKRSHKRRSAKKASQRRALALQGGTTGTQLVFTLENGHWTFEEPNVVGGDTYGMAYYVITYLENGQTLESEPMSFDQAKARIPLLYKQHPDAIKFSIEGYPHMTIRYN